MTEDSDPFAPIRRFVEQFDPSGTTAPVPGMGGPLSPMAMLGGGDLSPEGSTKQAVRQLYGALDAFSGAETSTDVWQQYLDAAGLDRSAFGPEQLSAAAVRTYRIWFYSLTQLLVETYSLRLVHEELVVDAHSNSTRTQEWLWGLPQADREQLLLRCTDVDDDLVEEMQSLRKHRDRLLYSFGDWDSIEFDESLADARRALDVLTALDALVTDGSAFAFLPDDNVDGELTEDVEGDTREPGDDGSGDDESAS